MGWEADRRHCFGLRCKLISPPSSKRVLKRHLIGECTDHPSHCRKSDYENNCG